MHTVSGSLSLPSQGFFSPFPHGTGSLSVSQEYLALEDGPPRLSPSMADLSRSFFYPPCRFWATPRSLAATWGISVDFFSCGYLDVSVLHVRFFEPMYSVQDTSIKRWVPPFGYLRITARLPAPRSFSQASTSFIASDCQGIHRMHLVT